MAGGHGVGFHPHLPGIGYRLLSKGLGAAMWFFIFYRARQDGAKLLGLSHPWEQHGHEGPRGGGHHSQ